MVVRSSRPLVFRLLLIVTLAFAAISSPAERVEDLPKPTNYVSDLAHVLSPHTVEELDQLCGQLDHSATNAQVAIVTVKNLDGDDKADFANRLEEKWKVGRKGSDRGILMLVSTEDRHYWIEVGYGLEGILPDAKVGDIGRQMATQLRVRNYDTAFKIGLLQISDVIEADAHVSLDHPAQPQMQTRMQPRPRHSASGFSILFRIILIVIVLAFFGIRGLFGFGLGMFLGGGGRGGWGGGGGGWGGGGDGGGGGGSGFGGFGGGESGGGGAGGDY